MLQVSSSILIDAPRERVFEVLTHPELFTGRMDSVEAFRVISRGTDSILAETRAGANGRATSFTLELRFLPPDKLTFHQIKGELRSLEGEDVLAVERDNGASTRVTETVNFSLGVPLGDLLGRAGIKQLIQRQVEERLAALKELAESR